MEKLYDRIYWENGTTPALNDSNLNSMSKAIDDIDNRVVDIADDILVVVPQIQAYLDQAEDLVEAMEMLSKNPPYIGENGDWYVWDTETDEYVDSEIDASITVQIADVTMLSEGASPYITNTGTDTDPIFHLFIPIGQTGAAGVGIASITKTGTSGLVDTYTITLTNGTTSTFTVTNGRDGTGSGDMTQADYDSTSAVKNAGGIPSYVEEQLPTVLSQTTYTDASGVRTFSFSDSAITTTSRFDYYCDVFGVVPTDVIVSSGSLQVKFKTTDNVTECVVEVK